MLTHDEFAHLLQRAAERDVHREPRLFTLGELVEAGREIGIAPVSVQDVYAEYQARHELAQRRPRPHGTRLHLVVTDDVLHFMVPPPSMKNATIATAVGATVLAGLAFMGLSFADSIWAWPFAVSVWAGSFFGIRHQLRQPGYELRLRRDGSGELTHWLGKKAQTYSVLPGQLRARMGTSVEGSQYGTTVTNFVALDHGTATVALLESYSHAERMWIIEEIERFLGR